MALQADEAGGGGAGGGEQGGGAGYLYPSPSQR